MLDTILILADSTYRARLLAGYGDIDDRMVGAVLVTHTAADADIVVDLCLTVFLEGNTPLGAIARTSSAHAPTTEVRHLIVDLHTRRTRLVDHAQDTLLGGFGATQCRASVLR